ncbi:MAG: polysaccharide deacetylase [Clostridia bacterium]|nr:polysaccharide deacetylase [Clostridia bacterium]
MFKSKKTYIKRYASKNIDKKIKFASSISSEFGNGGKISAVKPGSSAEAHKPQEINSAKGYSGEIKFAEPNNAYQPKYKFTSVDGDGLVNPGKVISGPGFVKPEPIDKPDLTNVKADAHVRPVLDTNGEAAAEAEPLYKTDSDAEEVKAQRTDVQSEIKAEIIPEPAETEQASTVAVLEKPAEKTASQGQVKKPAAVAQQEKPKQRNVKKQSGPSGVKSVSSGHRSNVFPVVAAVIIIIGILGTGGYYGYRYMSEKIERTNLLNSELAIVYGPEDYIYPETPQDVAAKVKADRDAAYNRAVANAYVPKRAEVPNLFKYDYVKTCYLTFDDGPNPEVTASILDTLKQYNVPATFFVVGKNAVAYPDLIKRMDAEGHSIGNHSYSHNYDYMYSGDAEFDEEMTRCKSAINNILGKTYPNLLYRFPGGSFEVYKQYYIWNIEAEGYQYVDWTALTGDSEIQNPDAEYIMNTLKESTNNGTKEDIVVLLHDAGAKKITAETLPQVIEYLKSKNYVFKAVTNSNFVAQ